MKIKALAGFLVLMSAVSVLSSQNPPAGEITVVIGEAQLQRPDGRERPLRMGMSVYQDNIIKTGAESKVEIKGFNGGVIRIAELSTVQIQGPDSQDDRKSGASVIGGKIWANMKAVILSDKSSVAFDTPTATAGIRGTVFRVDVEGDASATDVLVYEGKVVVKPEVIEKKQQGSADPAGERYEVGGPSEIEGPREVSLEEWITIVAGQQIRVEQSGNFSTWQFDAKKDSEDDWVRYNKERDAALEQGE